MNTIRRYGMGMGKNQLLQNVVDYGGAGLVGAGAQQLTNMVTGGADPNPLISGALMAPALTYGGRLGRFVSSPDGSDMQKINRTLGINQYTNPYSQAALFGSAASLLGGGAVNVSNTFAGGTDYDPNYTAAGLAILGSIAPLTAKTLLPRTA